MKDTIITSRLTNPLKPDYKLATMEFSPPTPPKFLRDSIRVDVRGGDNCYRILMVQSLERVGFMLLVKLWIIKILKDHILRNSK